MPFVPATRSTRIGLKNLSVYVDGKQQKILLLQLQPWGSNDCKRKSKRSNLTTYKNKFGDFREMGRLGKVKVDRKDGWLALN
jgi:hypothetical protein